ncbi:MAG TPA: hemerythrin domain-containing protein [Candidatus Competibacteraceae bacterium]|nr:MAG: hemerythrin domain-containing protein [Candidatus Competibacteraceae bacterium]HOB63087.1 hemerythrin domain-containing protein [Candidatus Competibacteraceae bacterium]HQA26757.1 hemerythrin domain-containing protein [Candidatus Competibacteraceae bacterium]HQD57591.1 hemerythrin domain-containing protein [Candidatus Competibacteraceae bacterium]
MGAVVDYFAAEHRGCDEFFSAAEEAAQTGDLASCRERFQRFRTAMEQHFRKEEEALFPRFEQASGNPMGPTQVMRLEHQQMQGVLAEMESALTGGDLDEFLGQMETLLILMQQHNIKEEQILYPMCDRVLGVAAAALIETLRSFSEGQPL